VVEQESHMNITPNATRYIQKVTKSTPVKEKVKRKANISTPGKYDQRIMDAAKSIYTGRGTL